MRIALITDGIHPFVIGGMQKHSYYIAKYLARLHFDISVFHCIDEGVQPDYPAIFTKSEMEHLTFIEIKFVKKHTSPGHYIKNSELYSESIRLELIKLPKFDFIYTKGFTGLNLLKNKEMLNTPIAVQLHGLEMFQPGGGLKQWAEKLILKKPARYCLKHADVIFTYGGKIAEIIKKEKGPKTQIIAQHGAADDFWLQTPSIDKKFENSFIFVGRHEHRKGLYLLLPVMQAIKEDFRLSIVGEVPNEKKIIDNRIAYLGNKNAKEIYNLFQQHTFLIVPSLAEGFPTIIVEAMAQGLVPIATDVGAIEAIINIKNGFLIKSKHLSILSDAIKKALSLPLELRKTMSKEARKTVLLNYNWDQAAKKISTDIKEYCDYWKRTHR